MKKILVLAIIFGSWFGTAHAATPQHVVGRILLQVENNGEAWYVDPVSEERLYVRNGAAAYAALRTFGLGITDADLEKIPVGLEERFEDTDTDGDGLADKLEEALGTDPNDADTDNDSFSDGVEVANGFNTRGSGSVTTDVALANRLKGSVVLQVESRGEAWYVHPDDGKRYYMKDGDAAYQIMRYLSLGITNADLAMIPVLSSELDCGDSYDCLIGAIQSEVRATATIHQVFDFSLIGIEELSTTSRLTHSLRNSGGMYTFEAETLEQTVDGEPVSEAIGVRQVCTYERTEDMIAAIEDWKLGNASSNDLDFAECEIIQP